MSFKQVANDLYEEGLDVRRNVLGSKYVDDALGYDDALSAEFQRFMTTYCWGEIWTDSRLAPAQHSLLVLGVTAALGKTREFEIHARGALRNGITPEQLIAVVRQLAVYAGVPAAVSILPGARKAIDEFQQDSSAFMTPTDSDKTTPCLAATPISNAMSSASVELHYRVDGELGNKIPTMLIHGVGSNLQRWDAIASVLGQYGPVVRYDLRGHGESAKPRGPYTLDDFVADHVGLMTTLGITQAYVVGMSLGGLIAQALTLRHPKLVARATFISAVAGRTDTQRQAVQARLRTVEQGGPQAVADGGDRWYTEKFRAAHPDIVDTHMKQFIANDPAAYAAAFRVLATTDLINELYAITVPTLIITGSDDIGSPPEMSRAMHQRITGSRLRVIDGIKHAILEEASDTVGKELCDFLY